MGYLSGAIQGAAQGVSGVADKYMSFYAGQIIAGQKEQADMDREARVAEYARSEEARKQGSPYIQAQANAQVQGTGIIENAATQRKADMGVKIEELAQKKMADSGEFGSDSKGYTEKDHLLYQIEAANEMGATDYLKNYQDQYKMLTSDELAKSADTRANSAEARASSAEKSQYDTVVSITKDDLGNEVRTTRKVPIGGKVDTPPKISFSEAVGQATKEASDKAGYLSSDTTDFGASGRSAWITNRAKEIQGEVTANPAAKTLTEDQLGAYATQKNISIDDARKEASSGGYTVTGVATPVPKKTTTAAMKQPTNPAGLINSAPDNGPTYKKWMDAKQAKSDLMSKASGMSPAYKKEYLDRRLPEIEQQITYNEKYPTY